MVKIQGNGTKLYFILFPKEVEWLGLIFWKEYRSNLDTVLGSSSSLMQHYIERNP